MYFGMATKMIATSVTLIMAIDLYEGIVHHLNVLNVLNVSNNDGV